MTAGAFRFFDKARLKLGQAAFNLSTDTLRGVLSTAAQALPENFVGTSTDCRYSDLTAELVGAGYTAGGVALTGVTWADDGTGKIILDFDNPTWLGLTGTFKYFSVYDDTNANNSLIGKVDLDLSGGGSITVSAVDYFVNVPAGGAFDLDQP